MSNAAESPSKSAVGYRKPPVEHRFKKGKSGNPSGRPKKARSAASTTVAGGRLSELILQEAYRPVQVRENDKVETIPMVNAIVRSLGVAGVKGSLRAQLAFAQLVAAIETTQIESDQAFFQAVIEYKRAVRQPVGRRRPAGVDTAGHRLDGRWDLRR